MSNVNGRKYAAFDLVVCRQSFMIAGIIMMGRGGLFCRSSATAICGGPVALESLWLFWGAPIAWWRMMTVKGVGA
jgi:hypothetical protein